jgi:hypothetical protein
LKTDLGEKIGILFDKNVFISNFSYFRLRRLHRQRRATGEQRERSLSTRCALQRRLRDS